MLHIKVRISFIDGKDMFLWIVIRQSCNNDCQTKCC